MLRILYAHPVIHNRGRHKCIAFFDAEFHGHVRLYGLRLVELETGDYRVYAPDVGKRRAATFSPDLAARMVDACLAKLAGVAHAA